MKKDLIICRSREIAAKLKNQILSGELPLSSPLPSIRKTAEKYGTTAQIVTSAMKLLEQDSLIQSFPRRGFQVTDRLPGGKMLILTQFTALNSQYIHYYMVPEIEKLCAENGYSSEKIPVEVLREGNRKTMLRKLRKYGFCGVFLCSSSYMGNEPEIELLRDLELPVVMPVANWGDSDITGFAAVRNDLDRCWETALRYLADCGYRRIGAIGTVSGNTVPRLGCHPVGQHFQYFRELKLETPQDPLLFLDLEAPSENNTEKLRAWLQDAKRFDAVLCYTGFFAPLVYKVCQEKKISIPGKLAMIGIGEYPGLEMLEPSLTTSGRPVKQSADEAMKLMRTASKWFRTGKVPAIDHPPKIFARESTKTGMRYER